MYFLKVYELKLHVKLRTCSSVMSILKNGMHCSSCGTIWKKKTSQFLLDNKNWYKGKGEKSDKMWSRNTWQTTLTIRIYFLVFFVIIKLFRSVVFNRELAELSLEQRCPTVFFRSPQLWRMNVAIRHINIQLWIQSNSVITNSLGPTRFVRYNRGSL